ncbi:MAG: trypsin-like peptidase domain-containing protein [Elusimicrobiaceae bacterium]|nr:trypsin-like peptidase domain-containing protein [Elusimicrobiaceae bacterium]
MIAIAWLIGQPCAYGYDHIYIAQQNIPAIVKINVLNSQGGTFTGTGFILSPTGLIVTNKHVLANAFYTNVTFSNGVTSGEAIVLAQDPKLDLAFLKIEAQHLPYATLADNDNVLVGQTITVIGNPRRLQNTVTSGIISQLRQQQDGTLWHQISAPISPSSSGSPVFDENGEVISVAFASIEGEGNQNLNFAIPVRYVKQLAERNDIALPQTAKQESANWLVRHLQKSWQITKRLLHKWLKNLKN